MTPIAGRKLTPPPRGSTTEREDSQTLAATAAREEGVLSMEDWAEIRRLHRAEGVR